MQQLYATIKKTSTYAHQQRRDNSRAIPFEVEIRGENGYCVYGNSNQYRLADLRFYVKCNERFVSISK